MFKKPWLNWSLHSMLLPMSILLTSTIQQAGKWHDLHWVCWCVPYKLVLCLCVSATETMLVVAAQSWQTDACLPQHSSQDHWWKQELSKQCLAKVSFKKCYQKSFYDVTHLFLIILACGELFPLCPLGAPVAKLLMLVKWRLFFFRRKWIGGGYCKCNLLNTFFKLHHEI